MARYQVADEGAAAEALLALLRLARRGSEDFTVSPINPAAIVSGGLTVTGAESLVSKTLAKIEGVVAEYTIGPD